MQVRFDSSQSFGSINSQNANKTIFLRIKDSENNDKLESLIKSQEKNPVDIDITVNKFGRLSASIGNGENIIKESWIEALFKLSPVKFIKKACKMANKMKA